MANDEEEDGAGENEDEKDTTIDTVDILVDGIAGQDESFQYAALPAITPEKKLE